MQLGVSINTLTSGGRTQLRHAHQAMTQRALVDVLDQSESAAATLVRGLWARFDDAPLQEQDWLLHNDPVALACDLAQKRWEDLDADKLAVFNDSRRTTLKAD